ncbi:nucleotide-binding domain-containing protein [Dothidotthia symphoricarpi CBS 119687]|uniref:Nucleotide-binding domain-containing protein n=1 Tax=Dothidotthia symphoricarpi CBS 119687 TaxID=1392245 RepID=A0A6A6ATB9_9PLEO|nr:nucleotide-binding domain-containing protein [Dothidotthia symphoricarpi CBS 119687]KAF2134097.1 nucleotide-binding domain-containing protein [Dothidotthia symphoricarpi CBS 119687]
MKTVCVIGAGPAGLVAAKTLLQHGGFSVNVYEAADRVGGMWRGRPGDFGDKCSPEMRTNLSRFTVAFPDLSWSSVDLSDPVTGTPAPSTPPTFPKAWQVGRYLETYAKKFNLGSSISFNKRVIHTKLLDTSLTWEVTCEDSITKQQETQCYDHVIVSTGFFDKPSHSFDTSPDKNLANVQHSIKFRELSSLTNTAGIVVVIGGGIGGSEAAAQAAFQISCAKNSPGKIKSVHAASKVYHITNRPFYCIPRYLPQDFPKSEAQDHSLAPTFLPLDLVFYNLSRRGEGITSAAITTVPPEKAKKGHEFMRSVLGSDQSELGRPELVYKPDQTQYPAYTGITDTYTEFVRSGVIVPIQGWVDEVKHGLGDSFDIVYRQYEPWYHAPGQDANSKFEVIGATAIIEATGYKNSLDFLDPSVKEMIHYDFSCSRIPILLTRGSVLAEVPTLGFVGFYEGPYWGMMELQARLLANTWTSDTAAGSSQLPDREIYRLSDTAQMRQAIQRDHSLQVPQFWMSDYIGLIEEFARETGMTRSDAAFGGQSGPAFPSRYQGPGTDSEAATVVQEVADLIKASKENLKFVAAAVFRAMQGIWSLHRKIDSRSSSGPGGIFSGTAHFHPRTPTDPAYTSEYLYIEEGTFTMDTGYTFPATRRYIYRYNETTDKITAWFADEDGASVASLFNTWNFYAPGDKLHGWMAKGHHWCDPDTYKNTCEFRFKGVGLSKFCITYQVEGPRKDYSHESWYERPNVE